MLISRFSISPSVAHRVTRRYENLPGWLKCWWLDLAWEVKSLAWVLSEKDDSCDARHTWLGIVLQKLCRGVIVDFSSKAKSKVKQSKYLRTGKADNPRRLNRRRMKCPLHGSNIYTPSFA